MRNFFVCWEKKMLLPKNDINSDSIPLGKGKMARRAYGFDEVSIVPGGITLDPKELVAGLDIGRFQFPIPVLASAMDGVVDVAFVIEMSKWGGLAVLNLDGLQTRYENSSGVLEEIANASADEINILLQKIYTKPVNDNLIQQRIAEMKEGGAIVAVSTVPQKTSKRAALVSEAGADILVIQGTVITARHISSNYKQLSFAKLTKEFVMPIIVGNCVSYGPALELMENGVAGILVGIGPGSACTSRGVLGIGVPQITATIDVAAARDEFHKQNVGKWPKVKVITDGGMKTTGDICKALVAGADGVMLGGILATAKEASGRGYHWGMATSDLSLPRGTRISVGTNGSLKEILLGPSKVDTGVQNILGAIQSSMGVCGAHNIQEFQQCELVIAPSILSEGKDYQTQQAVGMGARN
jgi:IMP dehydrogenase